MRWVFLILTMLLAPCAYSQTNSLSVNLYAGLTITGPVGNNQIIQYSEDTETWQYLTNFPLPSSPYLWFDLTPCGAKRFYRIGTAPMTNMVLIPGGSFQMGDNFEEGIATERPAHSVYISPFYMDQYPVTKALWDSVKNWGAFNGYYYDGNPTAKGINHPIHSVNWFNAIKWCNARSQMEGLTPCYYMDVTFTNLYRKNFFNETSVPYVNWNANGYRLPTEAEWEKAARGGGAGKRFPWGNMITHSNANYLALNNYWYDLSPTQGPHPDYDVGAHPYSNPIGAFPANDYGLYDMVGGLMQWCWDYMGENWYTNTLAIANDTQGPISGSNRVLRGGSYDLDASRARTASRKNGGPQFEFTNVGFRCVRKYED